MPKVNQPEANPLRPEAVKARSRSKSITAPVPLNARLSSSTPQRASPRAASQVAWNVRPTVWPRTWASERTSATKASRPRRIWPMAPRRISTRWPVSAQFTRQTSTSALSQRPSRMSVSVIRSEVRTPSASCASTDRSEPDRTSDAVSPLSGSKSVPSKVSVWSWSVKPKLTPSARVIRQHQASVVVPSSRWACRAGLSVFIGAVPEAGWR